MIDILYIGNCSVDKVVTENNTTENIYYGGSAVNSSIVSGYSKKPLNIGVLSTISKDYNFNFEKYNIKFLGEIREEQPVVFKINELNNSCIVEGNYQELNVVPNIKAKHVHISFRKGVSVETILDSNNIEFDTLSVDVMIHSIQASIKLIEKYKAKINFIFCNAMEYQFLKKLNLNNIEIIITNEEKPVIYISKSSCKGYMIPKLNSDAITSKTGAGDSFVGGFLSSYLLTRNIDESVYHGISTAQESLKNYGNEKMNLKSISETYDRLVEAKNSYFIPKTIIVIGSSCSGKSTFADSLIDEFPIYTNIDDYPPLKEVFELDDALREIKDKENLESHLIFSNEILNEYKNDLENINFYTSPSIDGGHNIDRPVLWDLILKYAVQNIENSFNIIQFSRGFDEKYESEFGKDVYPRSIRIILENLPAHERKNILVVNLVSNLEIRKKRNEERRNKGGHFVAVETMETVYKEDIVIDKLLSIPVINIVNDQHFQSVELVSFFRYNVTRVFENYTHYLGGK